MIDLNKNEIWETVRMIDSQNLDVRTVTMALSLLDCVGDDASAVADRIYRKIVEKAGNLAKTCDALSEKYGVPIVNKRVSVTPISLVGARCGEYPVLARALDEAAKKIGIDYVGGYTALVHKGITDYERVFIDSIPRALATTERVCGSVSVGSTRSGINMDAVQLAG